MADQLTIELGFRMLRETQAIIDFIIQLARHQGLEKMCILIGQRRIDHKMIAGKTKYHTKIIIIK